MQPHHEKKWSEVGQLSLQIEIVPRIRIKQIRSAKANTDGHGLPLRFLNEFAAIRHRTLEALL